MSSYKGHSIFAFILSLILFQNPLSVALAIIGANLPDFDHKIKRMYVIVICLVGALVTVILYHFKLPFYLGIVIISLGLIFLFSSHRGFTHSFLGIILQSLAIGLMLFLAFQLLIYFNVNNIFDLSNFNNEIIIVCFIVLFIAILFVNKRVLFVIFLLLIFTIWKFSSFDLSVINCLAPIFLGLFSHMVLDSFTPSGVRPFIPFSDKKYYKRFGIAMILILAIIFVILSMDSLNHSVFLIYNSLLGNYYFHDFSNIFPNIFSEYT